METEIKHNCKLCNNALSTAEVKSNITICVSCALTLSEICEVVGKGYFVVLNTDSRDVSILKKQGIYGDE